MASMDAINDNSLYFANIQSANIAQMKNQKTEKEKETGKAKRARFSDFLKTKSEEEFSTQGLPPEIKGMSTDEAAIYLYDAVNLAGNDLTERFSMENLTKFKKSVSQFIKFITENNFEKESFDHPLVARAKRLNRPEPTIPPAHVFSKYNNQPRRLEKRIQIKIINEKLDQITREMLQMQANNLKILESVNEIKGLVVNLLQG